MDKKTEIWKVHPNFPLYTISSYGRIMNPKTKRILKVYVVYRKSKITEERKPSKCRITLKNKDDKLTKVSIHSLVMNLFGPVKPNYECTIDHIDRNPLNNYYENLRWATERQQTRNRFFRRVNDRKFTIEDLENIFTQLERKSIITIAKEINFPASTLNLLLMYIHPTY